MDVVIFEDTWMGRGYVVLWLKSGQMEQHIPLCEVMVQGQVRDSTEATESQALVFTLNLQL